MRCSLALLHTASTGRYRARAKGLQGLAHRQSFHPLHRAYGSQGLSRTDSFHHTPLCQSLCIDSVEVLVGLGVGSGGGGGGFGVYEAADSS